MQKFNRIGRWHLAALGALILCLSLSVGALCFGISAGSESRTRAAEADTAMRRLSVRIEALEGKDNAAKEYLVQEHDGRIGVFNADKTVLYEIIDVQIKTLPRQDREMLREGIVVSGETALRAITEDYSS